MYLINTPDFAISYIGRIPNDHIEPTLFYNPVKFYPPVEWLVALLPQPKSDIILFSLRDAIVINAVLRGQVSIQFSAQYSQHLLKLPLVRYQSSRINILFHLQFAELLEGALDVLRLLLDALKPVIEDHLALHGLAHRFALDGPFRLVIGGKAYQSIAGADV